jgi:uncharacterized membrane protein
VGAGPLATRSAVAPWEVARADRAEASLNRQGRYPRVVYGHGAPSPGRTALVPGRRSTKAGDDEELFDGGDRGPATAGPPHRPRPVRFSSPRTTRRDTTVQNEDAIEARDTDRLILFSDAVVAIAITLLALELPVPEGRNVSEFWRSAREHHGPYLAFLISFFVISMSWSQHHRIYRYVERVDPRLRSINMIWLLTIVVNPLATKMLTTQHHDSLATHALRFGFYALLQVLASLTLLVISRHLTTHHLRVDGAPAPTDGAEGRGLHGVMLGFGLSIPVFFVTSYAWLLWIIVPLALSYLHRRPSPQDS